MQEGISAENHYTDPKAWKEHAQCKGMDPGIFYPHSETGVEAARLICDECGVEVICLEYALENKEKFGVWGGESEGERARILRRRRDAGK
jgi:WhiB family redox-sensing transcriptional regulator